MVLVYGGNEYKMVTEIKCCKEKRNTWRTLEEQPLAHQVQQKWGPQL
jgi:hypothetical protein